MIVRTQVTSKPEKPTRPSKEQMVSIDKFGKEVMDVGFTILPALLLRAQSRLGLNAPQMMLVIHLIDHWWKADEKPYPSVKTLGERIGIKRRQMQRYITDLCDRGYLKRIDRMSKQNGRMSNYYDLSGLVSELGKYAKEFKDADEQAKAIQEGVKQKGGNKKMKGGTS